MIGQTLHNRYAFTALLGKGAMGQVYRATDGQTGQEVAAKIIVRDLAFDDEMLTRFRREGEALRQLRHPNIVGFVEMFPHEGQQVIVMEYVPGGSLHALIKQGPLPIERARRIALGLCDALTRAHDLNIVHRDIKPENVLLAEDGTPKLSDFGLARLVGESARLTGTGTQLGTPYYMSPEAWQGQPLDAQTDIWSLGVVLFEMLTGEVPFGGETLVAVMNRVLTAPLPDLKKLRADTPADLVKIVRRMLMRDKRKRYQSLREVGLDLARLAVLPAVAPAVARPVSARPATKPRTAPPAVQYPALVIPAGVWIAAGVILIVLCCVGASVGVWLGRDNLAPLAGLWPRVTPTGTRTAPPVSTRTALPPAATTTPAAATQVPGFVSADPLKLVVALSADPLTLDPALVYDTLSAEIVQNVYETLIFYKREDPNTFVPQLATAWDISADGKTYTFTLRPGVQFHNGSVLTPEDVAYTFQRGLLQGGSGPQFMLAEPLLGMGNSDAATLISLDVLNNPPALAKTDPAQLQAACEKVTRAIVADNATGTVTFNLTQSWAPFLATLARPWGSIQSKAWVIANGGWDGSCATWQNYYGRLPETPPQSPLDVLTMGTGPYTLNHWTPGRQLILDSNPNYWRTEPAWAGGPAGVSAFKQIDIEIVSDESQLVSLAQTGGVDLPWTAAALDALVGETCDVKSSGNCVPGDSPAQPLRVQSGYLQNGYASLFFNWKIVAAAADGTNLIGSGKLDGKGVPPDFFSDVHVRRAFAYCFDYQTYWQLERGGDGVRAISVIPPGMVGYDANTPYYTYDPLKSAEEFKASTWISPAGVKLWDIGFRLTLPYNLDSNVRSLSLSMAQIFQKCLATVNARFVVEMAGLPGEDYLQSRREARLPIFVGRWFEDIHDPHNWVGLPAGGYGPMQSMSADLQDQFRAIIVRAVAEMDPKRRAAIYAEFNQLFYTQAPSVPLFLGTDRHYEQRWVAGWYYNPAYTGNYYYVLSKK